MKVLSLLQPWASLVVLGHKKIETRSWKTDYRGEILIHASVGKPTTEIYNKLQGWTIPLGVPVYPKLPYGEIIGKVTIENCVQFTGHDKIWRPICQSAIQNNKTRISGI